MEFEVRGGGTETDKIVTEIPKASITPMAQECTDLPRYVIVVYMERPRTSIGRVSTVLGAADRAPSVLFLHELGIRESEEALAPTRLTFAALPA